MRRFVLAALVGLLVTVSQASASGFGLGPGRFDANLKFDVRWGYNAPSGVLGPWYQYWPYEAHFITPAHPQFAFWPSPQTLRGGAPAAQPPTPVPAYWK